MTKSSQSSYKYMALVKFSAKLTLQNIIINFINEQFQKVIWVMVNYNNFYIHGAYYM